MDIIGSTLLFRLAEHAQVIVPALIAAGVLGLGPIGRAVARRLSGDETDRKALDSLRQQVAELQERTDYNRRLIGALRMKTPPGEQAERGDER
jgi:hypothetical protein